MSNIINTLGAGSGIDTASLVSQLVEVERAPQQNRIDSRRETLNAQISAYGTLKSALSTFQGILSPLANNDTFNARSVAFPDTTVITPNSLDAGAQTGTYQIEVEDVARSQSLAMGLTTDKNAAIGASGELSIQFGEWTYGDPVPDPASFEVNDSRAALNITVEATDTLASIAKKINDTKSGIQASVLSVDGQYQLMLTAPSGAKNALQITGNDPSLQQFEFNSTTFNQVTETQQASDAQLKINGLSVTRESNEITDVITGFNFTLNKASPGEKLSFTVEGDSSVAEQAIRDFVEAYNELFKSSKNLTGVTTDEETNESRPGDLSTDGSAKALIRQLRSMISQEVAGMQDGFTALTNVGIRTELDGTLSINETEFSAALSNNFDLVEDLFARNMASSSPYATVGIGTYATQVVAGRYDVVITQDPSKGAITGDAIAVAGSPTFSSALDTSAGDYSFKVRVNGTESDTITLAGTYNTAEGVRAELQSLINGDSKIKAARAEVDVSYDSGSNAFVFTSREYGASSKVSFTTAGVNIGELGITTALVGVAGKDVTGTINGEAGFGSGNVLLPAIDSDAYGLNLTIAPGATAAGAFTLDYTRGFAGEMNKLINEFLGTSGPIASREANINDQLDGLDEDQEQLDTRMEKYEARLTAQYLAMQQIISSLNSTGDSLDGILDRLPFTAKNN